MPTRLQLGTTATRFALAAWVVAMLALGAGLLARHAVALPPPANRPRLSASLGALRVSSGPRGWLSVHVLYAECRCSQRIVAHLLSSTRPAGWDEVVLWVGKAAPDPALARRFRVHWITSVELGRLGIEAAPSLVVLDPQNRTRYAGGYTDRKQGPVIDDLRILEDARRNDSLVAALPVFGCAVSDELKQALSTLPSP